MKPSEQPDLYQRLDVEPSANPDEIKQAYRRMAFEWHPDRNPNDPSLHEEFIAVSQAYEALSDSSKRAEYDIKRSRTQHKPVTAPPKAQPASDEFRNSNGPTLEKMDQIYENFFKELREVSNIHKNIYG